MESNGKTYISNQLIIHYLRHTLTEEEKKEIYRWLQQEKSNRDFLFGLEELYEIYRWDESKMAARTSEEWEKLKAQILQRKNPNRIQLPPFRQILKYAAILILFLSGAFYISQQYLIIQELQSPVSITTAKGERSAITLPDGSKVWLNDCSSISYTWAISQGERKVKMSGEAYFEVTKNQTLPFIVESKQIQTRVLGTKFNIRAYEDENYLSATLLEGSIQLTSFHTDFPRSIILKPGEKIICYDESGKTQYVNDRPNSRAIDWISGKLRFDNRPLELIARELEKRFDTRITFSDESLKKECFTCEFTHGETLHDILNILILTNKFTYTLKDKHILLSPLN